MRTIFNELTAMINKVNTRTEERLYKKGETALQSKVRDEVHISKKTLED